MFASVETKLLPAQNNVNAFPLSTTVNTSTTSINKTLTVHSTICFNSAVIGRNDGSR